MGNLKRLLSAIDRPILSLNKQDIATFLDGLACNPGGKHAYFRAIRAFYKWALQEDLITVSPIDRMKAPKVPKPMRHLVPRESLGALLAACSNPRDRLVVSMLADTGLRLTELANVKVEDIDIATSTAKVWGKGAHQRIVRFGPFTASLLVEYLTDGPQNRTLFGLHARGVANMLLRLQRRTGIKCNAHAFRRTFATESIRNGMNVFHVQSLLGHSSLTMTRIYAEQVNSEDAILAYKPIVR